MKIRASHLYLAAVSGTLALLPFSVSYGAEAPVVAVQPTQAAAPVVVLPTKLPYGVEDVVKLSRAQVGDDIIVNYVRNSGTIYNLTAADLVNLKNAGVSERVINAMLEQRKLAQVAVQPP